MNPYVAISSRYHAATSVTPVGDVQAALTGPFATCATGNAVADGKTGKVLGTLARIGPHGVEIDGVRDAPGEAEETAAVDVTAVADGVAGDGVDPQAATSAAASDTASREVESRRIEYMA
jgi:hypothetical protein